jgi:'Cold-shock' DNA-binding domain
MQEASDVRGAYLPPVYGLCQPYSVWGTCHSPKFWKLCHAAAIQAGGLRGLQERQPVRFDVTKGPNGFQAKT